MDSNTSIKGKVNIASADSYKKSLDWLFGQLPMFSRVGAAAYKPGLQTTEALDRIFDHPHRKFRSIHVGGTNGKGSVSHTLAAALQANGYKVGLYTSPHLVDFRERMKINGNMIPREEVVEFVEKWKSFSSELKPSFFELTMMMAFDWFARSEVDYAVIEVGMGGRLDSTNIITPLLSVITNISKDHTQFLGDTLEKIAMEKAGIIKPHLPVVIGETTPETRDVFVKRATEPDIAAPVTFAEESGELLKATVGCDGTVEACSRSLGSIRFPLGGSYQIKNLNTALVALKCISDSGMASLSQEKTRYGLEHVTQLTGLRGRWQILRQSPMTVCDTGHNYAGLSATLGQLSKLRLADPWNPRHLRFVIGFVNDKDVENIVSLFPADATYYFTQADIPRAMPADNVARIFAAAGMDGQVFKSVREAYAAAVAQSADTDIIYVGGSTFIVADLLASHPE